MKRSSVGVERSVERPFGSSGPRSYDECTVIPQSWDRFQRLRQFNGNKTNTTKRIEGNVQSNFANQTTPSSNDTLKLSLVRRDNLLTSKPRHSKSVNERKSLAKNDKHWARSWANHRAHQAVLTRNQFGEKTRQRSQSCETQTTSKAAKMNVPCRFSSVRSRNIELDAKAANAFSRLKAIYVNEEGRDRRLQSIRERMNEFQQKSIKTEVNKSIQEFNKKLKEDEQNRKELRRVREKFLETKKQRLRHMHVSRNALDVPAVSRLAYGLPQEGKEFSAAFSSKKTTDEIKDLWRMAFVRKQCIDSFIDKVSQMHQELPDVTVRGRSRAPSLTTNGSSTRPHLEEIPSKKNHLDEIQESKRKFEITSLAKLHTEILDSFESLSSDGEDYEQ